MSLAPLNEPGCVGSPARRVVSRADRRNIRFAASIVCMTAMSVGAIGLWGLGATSMASVGFGQDPFGAGAAGSDPFGGPPASGAPASRPPAAGGAGAAAGERDLVVRIVLESTPTTPVELARAMELMMNYGREDHAKAFLKRLIDARLNDQALAELEAEFGPPLFFRLMRDKTYAPEGEQFGRDVIFAASRVAREPGRLQNLMVQSIGPDAKARRDALTELRIAGPFGAAAVMRAAADPNRRADRRSLVDVLVALGDESVGPVAGALYAKDESTRATALEVLGRLRSEWATRHAVGPFISKDSSDELRTAAENALRRVVGAVPKPDEARVYLARRIARFEQGELIGRMEYDGEVEIWRWDEPQHAPVPMRLPREAAALLEAASLADDLYSISPDDEERRRFAIRMRLKADAIVYGLDQPLPRGEGTAFNAAVAAGPGMMEATLAEAIGQDDPIGATAAAQVLGEIGSAELLHGSGGFSPMIRAMQHEDRRLQFAALEAILKWNADRPYAGAGYVVESLGRFAATDGAPRALIGHPRMDVARNWGAMLESFGVEIDVATNGRDVTLAATKNGDYDLVLLSDRLSGPVANETAQILRKDARTARLPVGIVARDSHLHRAGWVADYDPLTLAFTEPIDTDGMSRRVDLLLQAAGKSRVSADERLTQAATALDWIARLSESEARYPHYELLRIAPNVEHSLRTPELAIKAAHALGLLGTPRAQQALVDIASQHALPLALRQAAATAFDAAVKRRGLRLASGSILAQYDIYNASETLDTETQQVLGAVLDSIEWHRNQERAAAQRNTAAPNPM